MNLLNSKITKNELIKTRKQSCLLKSKSIHDKLSKSLNEINSYLTLSSSSLSSMSSSKLSISFNGGKDSIAALISVKFFFYLKQKEEENEQSKSNQTSQIKEKVLFIKNINKVNTYENFLNFTNKRQGLSYKINPDYVKIIIFINNDIFNEEIDYLISILKHENLPYLILFSSFKDGLFYSTQQENIRNIVMGIRVDDHSLKQGKEGLSYQNQQFISKSDGGYPDFIRIYPIFEFDYYEIWGLILLVDYPYPLLYDIGYSSIGRRSMTDKNSQLKYEEDEYLPAYCLEDIKSERVFRK